jgi:hypothetical protein
MPNMTFSLTDPFRTSNIIATKALACKLAKAAWYLMAEGTGYDPRRMFGQPPTTK